MWYRAANSGDDALLSNMQMNSLDPHGVAMQLDYAGLQPDAATMELLFSEQAGPLPVAAQRSSSGAECPYSR
jgi:hypothetical protein